MNPIRIVAGSGRADVPGKPRRTRLAAAAAILAVSALVIPGSSSASSIPSSVPSLLPLPDMVCQVVFSFAVNPVTNKAQGSGHVGSCIVTSLAPKDPFVRKVVWGRPESSTGTLVSSVPALPCVLFTIEGDATFTWADNEAKITTSKFSYIASTLTLTFEAKIETAPLKGYTGHVNLAAEQFIPRLPDCRGFFAQGTINFIPPS